jgi:hypothetical protein
MGINTKDFSVYSIKHAAVSFLVRKKFSIEDIEKAMHFKQKKNTITNHYGIKDSIKRVGVILASAVHEPDSQEQNISENIVKADPEVKKAESNVELIKIPNTGIWETPDGKVKEVLKQRRLELTNDLKDIVIGKASVLKSFFSSCMTTFPSSSEFKAFKVVENIYKEQLFYVDPNLFNLEFPNVPPPVKMLKSGDSLPRGLTLSDVVNLPIANNNNNFVNDNFNNNNSKIIKVVDSDGIRISTPVQESSSSTYIVSEEIVPFEFPPLPSPPLKDKLHSKSEKSNNVKIEEHKNDDDDEEKKWSDKIDKAWGE